MRRLPIVALVTVLTSSVSADDAATQARPVIVAPPQSGLDAVVAPNAAAPDTNAGRIGTLSAGANSFTQAQARSRIESLGYTNVSELKQDAHSVWRGTAMKDGKTAQVALDYKGDVVGR